MAASMPPAPSTRRTRWLAAVLPASVRAAIRTVHIVDIIAPSDAIMVAPGDLDVEIPHEDFPGRQKELVRACRLTTSLASVREARPQRPRLRKVANAPKRRRRAPFVYRLGRQPFTLQRRVRFP